MIMQAGEMKAPLGGNAKAAILVTLLFFQLIMLPWFVTQAVYWSDLDFDFEDNPLLYLLLLPLVLGVVLIVLLVQFKHRPRMKAILDHGLLYAGFAGQIVLDWLFYAQVHRIFPFSTPDYLDGGSVPTGWLSSETMPFILLIAWLNVTGLLVVPTLVGFLSRMDPRGSQFKQSWHLGAGVFGLLLALRWGGPWSAPLHHLLYTAGSVPILMYLSSQPDQLPVGNQEQTPSHVQFFGSLGLNILFAWWFTILEFQSGTLLSVSLLSAIPASANFGVFLLNRTRKIPWETTRQGRLACRILWFILVTCTLFTILSSLSSFFTLSRIAWLIVGLSCSAFFPEFHLLLRREGARVAGLRLFFGSLFLLVFGILPYVANIYDPITSYAGLVLFGVFSIGPVLLFRAKRDQEIN